MFKLLKNEQPRDTIFLITRIQGSSKFVIRCHVLQQNVAIEDKWTWNQIQNSMTFKYSEWTLDHSNYLLMLFIFNNWKKKQTYYPAEKRKKYCLACFLPNQNTGLWPKHRSICALTETVFFGTPSRWDPKNRHLGWWDVESKPSHPELQRSFSVGTCWFSGSKPPEEVGLSIERMTEINHMEGFLPTVFPLRKTRKVSLWASGWKPTLHFSNLHITNLLQPSN